MGAHRGDLVAAAHHHRDVELRAALGDGAHVDAMATEHAEDLAGDSRPGRHLGADHRNHRVILLHHHVVDDTVSSFEGEFVVHGLFGNRRLGAVDDEADRMFRGALADQDHRNFLPGEGAEEALRDAGHAHHAISLDAHQGNPSDRSDASNRILGIRARSRRLRVPSASGSKVFLISSGIPSLRAGCTLGA